MHKRNALKQATSKKLQALNAWVAEIAEKRLQGY
jgi:hypothetical protein